MTATTRLALTAAAALAGTHAYATNGMKPGSLWRQGRWHGRRLVRLRFRQLGGHEQSGDTGPQTRRPYRPGCRTHRPDAGRCLAASDGGRIDLERQCLLHAFDFLDASCRYFDVGRRPYLPRSGMGTEYGAGSRLFAYGLDSSGNPAPMSGEDIRSEVGVGRVHVPLAYQVNEALTGCRANRLRLGDHGCAHGPSTAILSPSSWQERPASAAFPDHC